MIEIVHSGIQSSVQDLGRVGFCRIGVAVSGAMDAFALKVANILVGNEEGAAAIEATLGGFEIRFLADTIFALTGADAAAALDGEPLPPWWVQGVSAGQTLKAGWPRQGMRSYVAVSGGLEAPVIMGSRSTDLKGGFGGLHGRALQQGDQLEPGLAKADVDMHRAFGLSTRKSNLLPPDEPDRTVVRFTPAAEWETIGSEARRLFRDTEWQVQPDSNRIGYRLTGPAIQPETARELFSHGIVPGTIQLPPSGLPVIQLNDGNTSGGYPKLGVVIKADLRKLGQVRLGGRVRFALSDTDEALQALGEEDRRLRLVADQAELARQRPR